MRHAVSVVVRNENNETLFALRSANESSYPLVWSLPSHYVKEGESPEETVKRIGINKLGVELESVELLNEGVIDRGIFTLFMHDYSAKIVVGDVKLMREHYEELKWSEPISQLQSMEIMGDCCRLYKEYLESTSI